MKTPKKKQLYDVCELVCLGGINYHIATPHTNIPASMARYYVRTLPRPQKGSFFMYVKNGFKPLDVLRERKLKAEARRQDKMHAIATKELENSYKEHLT